ncbi:GNAT family N-acetyltransferase [Pseudodesulfovibrio sediminis]|uniref:N-acetyltransferase n=1 Tax=Pseudodesulfovibrio sediminis TaxID=2810563 RepID=A0ABN6EV84_9BACT|nr:GNAT family N-acetyltransferase [Pseudodesulfovibrio sediminis]BCS88768.1 N-acetyltransferase [Pseudodesulfovibrio sediminis]
MADRPIIRTMTREDMDVAITLAAAEGWNPGLTDGASFYAADPDGFFISELNGEPVGTISAVRYGSGFGFIGLYIVVPAMRGKGYGLDLWNHAMTYLEGRNVGLDAVIEQEQTYKKAGFTTFYRSARYEGVGGGTKPDGVTPLQQLDMAMVAEYDRQCFPAARDAFLQAWLSPSVVTAFGVVDRDRLTGFGVIRPCKSGYKIGPLFADSAGVAEMLYRALKASVPDEPVYLDVISPNKAALELVKRHGLHEIFATVRMYTGGAPDVALKKVYGITSFELG